MTFIAEKTGKAGKSTAAAARRAEIVREYGPFAGADKVAGVSHDGRRVWIAGGAQLIAFDPESGEVARTLDTLKKGAAGTENTMPLILDCVKAYCTVGEISDALRDVYGTYEEPAVF